MFYERNIRYFDYLENKERLRGAGFVKLEVREERCSMLLQLSGLRERDRGEKQVFLTDGKKEQLLGSLHLENRSGKLQLQELFRENLGSTGIAYQELTGIRIPLGGSCEIFCSWKKGEQAAPESSQSPSQSQPAKQPEALPQPEPLPRPEGQSQSEVLPQPEPLSWLEGQSHPERQSQPEALPQPEPLSRKQAQVTEQTDARQLFRGTGKEASTEKPGEAAEKEVSLSEKPETSQNRELCNDQNIRTGRLMEHKWQQLSVIYPHIKPFEDERDYLSIGPGDFVIFPEKYYKMANNSFLLHGYYNYEHLILARVEKQGRSFYYVGVPGNFYDREKQVALMFGFESFECLEEPARQGDFGYYMMRMEL